MMTERDREKIKLTANYRNGLAVTFFAAGGLTSGLGFINRPEPDWNTAIWIVFASAAISLTLHVFALAALRKLPG
jgi:hypothetical protein